MKSIRVVAVGFLVAMALLMNYGQEFFTWWLSSATFQSWALAVSTISPSVADVAGLNLVGAAAFIVGCLGIGLLVSTILFDAIEVGFGRMVAVFHGRIRKSNRSQLMESGRSA